MSKIILGAPSLNGKGANELIAESFKDAAFPLKITVINLVDNGLSFPEVEGFYLTGKKEFTPTVTVEIKDYDTLQRLASSIETVAEINSHESMLTIDEWVGEPVVAVDVIIEPDSVVDAGIIDTVIEPELVADATDAAIDTGKKAGKAGVV